MERIIRVSRISRTHEEAGVCLRCRGETLISGLCVKCDEELSRIAAKELRRYATREEINEWCVMHYIDINQEEDDDTL